MLSSAACQHAYAPVSGHCSRLRRRGGQWRVVWRGREACPRRDALVLLVLVALRGGARQLVERARVLVLEVGAAAAVVVQLARHAGRRLGARLQHARLLRELHADVCNSNYVENDVNAHYVMRVFS